MIFFEKWASCGESYDRPAISYKCKHCDHSPNSAETAGTLVDRQTKHRNRSSYREAPPLTPLDWWFTLIRLGYCSPAASNAGRLQTLWDSKVVSFKMLRFRNCDSQVVRFKALQGNKFSIIISFFLRFEAGNLRHHRLKCDLHRKFFDDQWTASAKSTRRGAPEETLLKRRSWSRPAIGRMQSRQRAMQS